jgi:hypothetical protein
MSLFGLECSNLIIAVGSMLLISGAIIFYCLRRFSVLENSLCEQGKVLQTILVSFQNPGTNYESQLAHPQTVAVAQELYNTQNLEIPGFNKDGEDDGEDEDEDDDDDDGSSYSSYSEHSESNKIRVELKSNTVSDTKDVKVIEIEEAKLDLIGLSDLSSSAMQHSIMHQLQDVSCSSDSESIIDLDNNFELSNVDKESVINKAETVKGGATSLKKLKIADLRALALEKGLIENDESQTFKKDNLIKILKDN